jgi:hypothetical protein
VSGKRLLLTLLAPALVLAACSDNPVIGTPSSDPTATGQGVPLVIEPGSVSLTVGQSARVSALLNQNGDIQRNLPTTWVSLDTNIVSVDAEGQITALRPGNAQVRAESLGFQALVLVSVSPAGAANPSAQPPTTGGDGLGVSDEESDDNPELARLRSIVVRPENETVQPTVFQFSRLGEQRQFVAVGKDSEGQDIRELTFSWSSSDEAVATVNSTGVVTAVATGTTNLIASAGNVTSNIVQIQVQEGTIRANIRFTE